MSIETDINVMKTHAFLNFVEKYVRLKLKKKNLRGLGGAMEKWTWGPNRKSVWDWFHLYIYIDYTLCSSVIN